jgi:phosphatidylglycerophosphatase A
MQRLGLFIATCAYVGYAPIAPGTFGSAAGLVVFYAVRSFGSPPLELAVIAVVFVLGIWSASVAERHFNGTDPGPVVIDEVLGMLVTLALLPVTFAGAVVGFLVFRVLDVIKPWPSAGFERLPGGLGVMADDGMAAVYANLIMRVLLMIAPAGWLA